MENRDTICFENLSKQYGDFTALHKISFEIPKNTILGLIGANGSGKTTLIKCLLGHFNDFTGKISIWGEENRKITQKQSLLSYIPDSPVLYEELTLIEHLEFISGMYRTCSETEGLIREFALEAFLNKFPHELSKGNKQKLLICCALLREYEVLVCDEPFSGLDPIQIKRFQQKLLELKGKGKTIVLSTHLLSLIENLCDHFVMIHAGRLIGTDSIGQILKQENGCGNLEELYLHLAQNTEEKTDE